MEQKTRNGTKIWNKKVKIFGKLRNIIHPSDLSQTPLSYIFFILFLLKKEKINSNI
nr:MAG TPA: hypothetical protein [Caudoviricetes sp.]